MKPSRIRTGLLTFLITAVLSLGGTARAQLEEFTELLRDDLSFFDPLFLKFARGNVQQITVRGTIDTTPTGDDLGKGPVFGISGAAVPIVAYLFIDVSEAGPVESLAEGSFLDGYQLASDMFGYQQSQIIGVYLVVGDPAGPKKEVGFLNPYFLNTSNRPRLPSATIADRKVGTTGPVAKAWFDDLVDTGEPEACSFYLNEWSSEFWMGGFFGGPPNAGFYNITWVYDGVGGKYAYGTVTSVDVEDTSEGLNRVLANKAIADRLFQQAKTKLAKFKAKAKKKGVAPGQYGPYKKAQKKYDRALAAAQDVGLNPVE